MSDAIDMRLERAETALKLVLAEITKATLRYGSFNSPHEGYAVMLEEVDELWDDIKKNRAEHSSDEAIQVAAMAVRYLVDCVPWHQDESGPISGANLDAENRASIASTLFKK